jgi:hypothetical protein
VAALSPRFCRKELTMMTTRLPMNAPTTRTHRFSPLALWRDAWRADAVLMTFAALLFALLVPMAFGLAFDERTLRGVNVWVKPMKFALSLGVLAWTTAYFSALVQPERRRALALVRWALIGAATFEIAYITLQAALGQASHYNVGTPLRVALYQLMGLGALMLTGSQALLAWLVARHARPGVAPAFRLAAVFGLAMAFVFGTAAGVPLSMVQPPDASALPLFGWHLRGDLRPAHFVGLHAEQLLPLLGAWAVARHETRSRAIVIGASVAWTLLFVALMVLGLSGARVAPGY